METRVLHSVNKILRYIGFPRDPKSLLSAVYHQVRLLKLELPIYSQQEFKNSLLKHLTANELYSVLPARHDAQILRVLVHYFKVSIELYYTSGYKQTFPFLYQLNEPAIRLLSLNAGYGSITQVTAQVGFVHPPPNIISPVRLATWNVQGARLIVRRKLIDTICYQHGIELLCLQDARFHNNSFSTENYEWIASGAPSSVCSKYGCFILLRKNAGFKYHQYVIGLPAEESLVVCVVRRQTQVLLLVNAYLPCNGTPDAPTTYNLLDTVITKLRTIFPTVPMMICGDFNGHLGDELQRDPEMAGLVGPNLLHTETNENGEMLAGITRIHRLGMATTLFSSSTTVTRTHGNTQSQLDHILIHENLLQHIINVYGQWQPISDHKLIVLDVTPPAADDCKLDFGSTDEPARRPHYDLRKLGIPKVAKEFNSTINEAVVRSPSLCALNTTVSHVNVDLDECNTQLTEIVKMAAEKHLKPGSPMKKKLKHLQERRELFKRVHANHKVRRIDSARQYNRLSDYPAPQRHLIQDLVKATRAYERARKEAERAVAENVLRKMTHTSHINVRLDICFKFLKARKRSSANTCPAITHQSLELELAKLDHGPIPTIPLNTTAPMPPPPAVREFDAALLAAKTGVSPGLDKIHAEFYHSSPQLRKLTAKLMHFSFIESRSPAAWSETSITLIPKTPSPKMFSDMRPITLSPVAYKAFARVLLERLQEHIGEIKPYQSGFLNNRSCDDQHFAQQRILETEWNHKRPVYMLSLDFKQAFSSVNLHKLAEVLTAKKVPCYLINLIINTCLSESTSINWMGTATNSYRKTVGVKQGCTIAPYLFVVTLDVILARAQKELRESHHLDLYLGESDQEIQLPLLFAYADDLNIFAHTTAQLNLIMATFIPIMREYGLELNSDKCHLVRKSPIRLSTSAQNPTIYLGGLKIPIQKSMTVLGSTYSEDMDRRQMILARCMKTVRLFYAMRKHLMNCQLSFDILVRLYKVVLAPVLLFGLRSVSITKGNQMILVRREMHILRGLAQIASPPVNDGEVFKVLKGRTINRRLTVSRLVFHGHVARAAANGLLKKALNYKLNLKRKVGRPLFTYSKTIQNELASLMEEVDEQEWIAALHNREKLKTLCERIYERPLYPGDPMPSTARLSDPVFAQSAR